MTEKDDIIIDRAFSSLGDENWQKKSIERHKFLDFQRHIPFPRVVPYYSYPSTMWVEGKVRNEPFVQVQVDIPSGLELRYQGRHWSHNERVALRISYELMRKLIDEFGSILKRYDRD